MARLSMRTRLLCAAGAVGLMTAIPVAHPASAQGLNDIVRNLNNTMNPNGAQPREDQARREDQAGRDGRLDEGRYRHGDRPPSESREHNWDGGDRRNYGDRRDNAEGRQPTFSYR
jgi:Ni/Co efflux regulator RcnB